MAVSIVIPVVEAQGWPQLTIRDPLGTWGGRGLATGDASGGGIRGTFQVEALKRSAFVYTLYSVNIAQLSGTVVTGPMRLDLLTNWPNIDPLAGVQAYRSVVTGEFNGSTLFPDIQASISSQNGAPHPMQPSDRFILLYDPRASGGPMDIVLLTLAANSDMATYSFEAWGYYWDRSVLNAPGGPRHPGSG